LIPVVIKPGKGSWIVKDPICIVSCKAFAGVKSKANGEKMWKEETHGPHEVKVEN
jgi:hypothetical protein